MGEVVDRSREPSSYPYTEQLTGSRRLGLLRPGEEREESAS